MSYFKNKIQKFIFNRYFKFFALQINGLFPFLCPLRHIFRNFSLIKGPLAYISDYLLYKRLALGDNEFPLKILDTYPCLYDRYAQAGDAPRHYFYQDLWAAKKVFLSGVKVHYDIGSRLDGFIAHCLCFCEVIMLDIRPLKSVVPNLKFIQADCTNMPHISSGSIHSISSLHAIEHFGLGRYGDSIDPNAYKKAITNLARVTKAGGNIYFSVPIGKQRVEFNAHRIFDPRYVVSLFEGCGLIELSVVGDNNQLIENAEVEDFIESKYACGLFHFRKM